MAPGWSHHRLLLAAGLLLCLGAVAGILIAPALPVREWISGPAEPKQPGPDDWRSLLAERFSYSTSQTLLALPTGDSDTSARLAALSKEVGMTLTPENTTISNHVIAMVDYLFFNNERFGEIVYVGEQSGAVALIIVRRDGKDTDLVTEEHNGMNIVSWTTPTHAFMLTGLGAPEELRSMATVLIARLAG